MAGSTRACSERALMVPVVHSGISSWQGILDYASTLSHPFFANTVANKRTSMLQGTTLMSPKNGDATTNRERERERERALLGTIHNGESRAAPAHGLSITTVGWVGVAAHMAKTFPGL